MLTTYQEIRDRIYQLARQRQLMVDWTETTSEKRYLRLYDSAHVVVANTEVPVRNPTGPGGFGWPRT